MIIDSLNFALLTSVVLFGSSLSICPDIYSTKTLRVTCWYNDTITSNCVNAVPGTWASFKCFNFHEGKTDIEIARCNLDGQWDHETPTCVPICGRKSKRTSPLIINGFISSEENYPWLAALYTKEEKRLVCGATLISEIVVVTAAHCVADQNNGTVKDKENYIIAVGKFYSKYDDPRDSKAAQFSTIQRIIVSKQFKGHLEHFTGDIAILVTAKAFAFSSRVQPICIDYNGEKEKSRLSFGSVFGWGVTESGHQSIELRQLHVPIADNLFCRASFFKKKPEFIEYMTPDKICAGFFDQNVSVCEGDSGGGLFVNHDGRFFLEGVLSLNLTRSDGHCDSGKVAIFTNVRRYIYLINATISMYNIDKTNVSNQICPDISTTDTLKVRCEYNNSVTIDCVGAVHGTIVHYKCANFYEISGTESAECQGGIWSENQPSCIPVCGTITGAVTTLIIQGNNKTEGTYPWQVALYRLSDKELICGGSLITERLVITAAHCVTYPETGQLQPTNRYLLAVGKYYRNLTDERDKNTAQISPIEKIFTPKQYEGNLQNFYGDIAILVSALSFVLSSKVQPVCLDYSLKYEADLLHSEKTKYGYVTGWGYTVENGQPSEVLKEVKVPHVPYNDCKSSLPTDTKTYLTYDKICAGYFNQSTSVCLGDSGGGLVFKHQERHYLTGIVSISPSALTEEGGCNSDQVGLYTKVTHYISFIKQTLLISEQYHVN